MKPIQLPLPQAFAYPVFDHAFKANDASRPDVVRWLLMYWHLISPVDRTHIVRVLKRKELHAPLQEAYAGPDGWDAVLGRYAAPKHVDFVLEDKDKSIVAKAVYMAVTAHDGAGQLYAGQPYSGHVLDVYEVALENVHLLPVHKHEKALGGAGLHDTIEDGYYSMNDLAKELNADIARVAQLLVSSTGPTRKERHDDAYYQRLATSETATFVKLCDRLANVRAGKGTEKSASMRERYRSEQAHVESQLQVETRFPRLVPLLEELRAELALPTVTKEY